MKLLSKLTIVTLISLVLALALQASNNPKLISYQGRLVNSQGVPLNGPFTATFRFYDNQTLGNILWQESATFIASDGYFTHLLGSVTPIPDSIFPRYADVWLQVIIGTEVLTPRVRVTSAGYALQVHTIDQAEGGIVSDSIVLLGSGRVFRSPDGSPLAMAKTVLQAGGIGSSADFYEPLDSKTLQAQSSPAAGALRTHIGDDGIYLYETAGGGWHTSLTHDPDGFGGGMFRMSGNGGGFVLDGNFGGTGNPKMTFGGNSWITLNADQTGDMAVELPSGSINATELLNEPGIVNNIDSTSNKPLTTTMQDLVIVTITIPADGYIFLTGKVAEAQLLNTTGSNYFYLQVDETAGGGVVFPNYSACGAQVFPNNWSYYYSPFAQRTYHKPAGTYTFRLEACRGGTGTGAAAYASYATLTAMYYPTAYGTVEASIAAEDLGQFDRVVTVPSGTTSSTGVAIPQTYIADLRQFELRAAKARAEAEKAERLLLEAKLRQSDR